MKAYAKVNLRLKVLGTRQDRYHELEMINVSTDLADDLFIEKRNDGLINIKSNLSTLPLDSSNLVYKVLETMRKQYGISDGFDVYIEKRIPVGAGLGGGSTDCAAALMWFNETYQLGLGFQELIGQATKFGSDVPYCLFNKTAIAKGRGELLHFVTITLPKYIIIATPDLFVSTKEIFMEFDQIGSYNGEVKELKMEDSITNIYDLMENDLERVTLAKYPFLKDIKNIWKGLGFTNIMMSGSGPTMIALTNDYNQATEAIKQYQHQFPKHFVSLNKII